MPTYTFDQTKFRSRASEQVIRNLASIESLDTFSEMRISLQEMGYDVEILPTCIGCKKSPEELYEFRVLGKEYRMEPTEVMKREEGTYNKFQKNKFYCTICYVDAGMPLYDNVE